MKGGLFGPKIDESKLPDKPDPKSDDSAKLREEWHKEIKRLQVISLIFLKFSLISFDRLIINVTLAIF